MTPTKATNIRPLSGVLGAEICGVDLANIDQPTLSSVHSAFLEHHVLVFRDQELSPEQQMAFAATFGELDEHPFVEGSDAHPHVLDVITQPDDYTNFGGGWHTDLTFLDAPDLGSVLYALEVPDAGGDTLFANQHAAYDALSDVMKSMLDGLTVMHSAEPQYGQRGMSTHSKAMITKNAADAATTVEHPLVRTHPATGRKGLYVNRAFCTQIVGMHSGESQTLLNLLCDHAVAERFTCRVPWRPGTLTMWDNRSVQHYALFDYEGQLRRMRRVTIKGDRPVA